MCIIAWITQPNNDYKLILIANRDESYIRPTANSHFWTEKNIIAGEDLLYHGTQLAVNLNGKIAVLTNLAPEKNDNPNTLTRGLLTVNYFESDDMKSYAETIQDVKYMPYNLLLGDIVENKYTMSYSKYNGDKNTLLESGKIYVLENKGLFDHVERSDVVKGMFEEIVRKEMTEEEMIKRLFGLLNDECAFRLYLDKNYGTRTQTIILIGKDNKVSFIERSLWLDSLEDINEIVMDNMTYKTQIINNERGPWTENWFEFTIKN